MSNSDTAFVFLVEKCTFQVINIHITKMSIFPPIHAIAGVGRVKETHTLWNNNSNAQITVLTITRGFVVVIGTLMFILYSVWDIVTPRFLYIKKDRILFNSIHKENAAQ